MRTGRAKAAPRPPPLPPPVSSSPRPTNGLLPPGRTWALAGSPPPNGKKHGLDFPRQEQLERGGEGERGGAPSSAGGWSSPKLEPSAEGEVQGRADTSHHPHSARVMMASAC